MKLELHAVSKAYNGNIVLQDFSMTFPSSGTVCLFGPSGCGKTTLLNGIAGLERFDGGTVDLEPKPEISYIFQEDRLLPWISTVENVAAVLRAGKRESLWQARRWLRLVGLEGEEEKLPSELSGGMRRRVAIARALTFGGGLFLLDEPFQRLDEKNKWSIVDLLQKKTRNTLTILVTHDAKVAEKMADVVYFVEGPPLKIQKVTPVKLK